MVKSMETKAYGSIRNTKSYGACGVILGMALLGMAFSSPSVQADQLAVADQPTVVETKSVTEKATIQDGEEGAVQEPALKILDSKDSKKDLPENKTVEDQKKPDLKKEAGSEKEVDQKDASEKTETVKEADKKADKGTKKTLKEAVEEAEKAGVTVTYGEKVTHDDEAKASQDTEEQVKQLEKLTNEVLETKASIEKLITEAKKAGVVFDGVDSITVSKGEDLKTRTKEVEEYLNALIQKQKEISAKLDGLVNEYNSKGLSVKVVGTKIVEFQDADAELQRVKAKLEAAKLERDKVEMHNTLVSERNKSAKAVLAKDSTAQKIGNVYTQTITAKANVAGQKGIFTLTSDSSAQLLSVELVSPEGKAQKLDISNNGVTKAFVAETAGDYKVVYTFGAKENKAGSVKSILKFDGKEAVVKTASDKIEFEAKSKVETTTNTTKSRKSMTFVEIIDFSGSLSSTEMKMKGYTGSVDIRREQLKNIKTIIDTKLTDDDDVYLGFYTGNYAKTYGIQGGSSASGAITRKLKKAEASKLIGDLLSPTVFGTKNPAYQPESLKNTEPEFLSPLDDANGENLVSALQNKFSSLFYQAKANDDLGFEEIIDRDRDKSKTLSVLQFTDFWYNNEEMDKTFAEWAKKNAKTFMTVIDREFVPADQNAGTGFKPDNSEKQMKALGHPNIYIRSEINAKTEADIIKQFESTAVEKVESKTTVTKQKGVVDVVASKGLKLTSVKMIAPNGTSVDLPIQDGKATFSGDLSDGKYTVTYSYTGEGTVSAKALADGKTVAEKVSSLKSDSAVAGVTSSKTDQLEAVPLEKERVFDNTVEVSHLVIKAKEPKLEKVETEVHEVAVKAKTKVLPKTSALPNTGSKSSGLSMLLGAGLAVAGLFGFKKKEEEN